MVEQFLRVLNVHALNETTAEDYSGKTVVAIKRLTYQRNNVCHDTLHSATQNLNLSATWQIIL